MIKIFCIRIVAFATASILGSIFANALVAQTSYYWNPPIGSANNYSTVGNWRKLHSNGTVSTSLPTSSDTVFIGNNTGTCNLDIDTTINTLLYQGSSVILLNNSSHTLKVKGNITLSNTASTGGGSATINLIGSGTQYIYGASSSGVSKLPSLTINSTGIVQCSGYITMGGSTTLHYLCGTFNTNLTNFVFYYNNILTGNIHIKNAEFQGNGTSIWVSDTLFVDSTLTTSGSAGLNFVTGIIKLSGNMNVNNTASFTIMGANLMLTGIKNQTLASTAPVNQGVLPPVTINKTGGTLSLSGTLTVCGSWINNYSTSQILYGTSEVAFGFPNSTMHIGGTHNTPFYNLTFNVANNVTCVIDNDSAAIVKDSLKIAGARSVTWSGHCIPIYGNINIGGNYAAGGGNTIFILKGNANQSITSTAPLGACMIPSVTIQKGAGTLKVNGIVTTTGNWINNYSTSNIAYTTTGTLYFYSPNSSCTAGGTYSTPIHKLIVGGSSNTILYLTADSAFIVKDTLLITGSNNGRYAVIDNYSINIEGELVYTNGYSGAAASTCLFRFRGNKSQTFNGVSGLPWPV